MSVSKAEAIAFRLAGHHLSERLNEDGLEAAAGSCGIQNSPPGSALLALHARVRNITQQQMDHAITEKILLQSWAMRGSPYFFPTADASVFTSGVLPTTEGAMRHFILGVEQSVDRLGISLTEAVDLTGAHLDEVLAGRQLSIGELGAELADRIAPGLTTRQRAVWDEEGPHAAGQPVGEAVVHFCIRILTLQGLVCFAPRAGNKAPFVLVEEWLGHPIPNVDLQVARAELLRRYLHCYGPSTRTHFAAWVGVRAADADAWWTPIEDELTPVDFGGGSWILSEDLDKMRSASVPKGTRLLPPSDPYTQLRDRDTIVEKKLQSEVWKAVGAPGTILRDGEIVGTWRSRKIGRTLSIAVTQFGSLTQRTRTALHDEAEQIGALRGASSVDLTFAAD
jgi:hypothetical protein